MSAVCVPACARRLWCSHTCPVAVRSLPSTRARPPLEGLVLPVWLQGVGVTHAG